MTDDKIRDAIWDTGFDHERQEPLKSEFDRDFDRWMQDPGFADGYHRERAKIGAAGRAKVYCPLCLHPVVRHESHDGPCGDCDCKGEDWYQGYQ
jgi:hypothetical protein